MVLSTARLLTLVQDIDNLVYALGLILNLGNIEFKESDQGTAVVSNPEQVTLGKCEPILASELTLFSRRAT